MATFFNRYRPVHKGVSIVDREAYDDYREWSEIRDPSKLNYYKTYKKLTRKIWKKIAEYSVEYESGVYDSQFFYLVPQVVDNRPFIEMPTGKIKTNTHTKGDMYSPIFCNIFKQYNHFCWSVDGCFVKSYKDRLNEKIDKFVPKYYFILDTLKKNTF